MLHNRTVLIKDGVVARTGSRPPMGAKVVDAKGKTLLPALIDSVAAARDTGWIQVTYHDGFAWGLRHKPVSFEALHDEIEAIHKENKRALIEVGSLRESVEALKADADALLRIFAGAQSDPAFAKLAARRKVFVIPMLAALEGAPRREGSLEALRQLRAAQVPLLAGGADLARELELLVRDAGLSPVEALRSATSVPVRIFGIKEQGRMILVDGDPAVSIGTLRSAKPVN